MHRVNKKVMYGSFLIFNILNTNSIDSDKYEYFDPTASSSRNVRCSINEKIKNQEAKLEELKKKNEILLSVIIFCTMQEYPHFKILNEQNQEREEISRIISGVDFNTNSQDLSPRLRKLIDEYRANNKEILNLNRANNKEILNLNKSKFSLPIAPTWSHNRDDTSKYTKDEAYQLIEYHRECIHCFTNMINKFLENIIFFIHESINLNFPGVKKLKNSLINCSDIKEKEKKIIKIITDPNFKIDKHGFLPDILKKLIYEYKIALEYRSCSQEFLKKFHSGLKNSRKSRKKIAKNPTDPIDKTIECPSKDVEDPADIVTESASNAELTLVSLTESIKKDNRWSNGGKRISDEDYKKCIEKNGSVSTSKDSLIKNIFLIFKKKIEDYSEKKDRLVDIIISTLENLPSTNNHINQLKSALINCLNPEERSEKIIKIIDDPDFKSNELHSSIKNLINQYKVYIKRISCLDHYSKNIQNLLLNKLSSILENIASDHFMFGILREALIEDQAVNTFSKTPKILEFIYTPGNMDIYYSMLGITDEDPDDSKVDQYIINLDIKDPPLSDFFKYINKYIEIAYSPQKDSCTLEDTALSLLI